jgi:hypothetical protein
MSAFRNSAAYLLVSFGVDPRGDSLTDDAMSGL